MNCCRRRKNSDAGVENGESFDPAYVALELHKLIRSNGQTGRMRFGDGFPAWVKIVKAGTSRPEVTLLVNGTPRRFRARCLPVGAGTLEECETLERVAALPPSSFDLVVPARMANSMLLVRLLGIDEHMNVCFRLEKPWDEL